MWVIRHNRLASFLSSISTPAIWMERVLIETFSFRILSHCSYIQLLYFSLLTRFKHLLRLLKHLFISLDMIFDLIDIKLNKLMPLLALLTMNTNLAFLLQAFNFLTRWKRGRSCFLWSYWPGFESACFDRAFFHKV